MKEVIDGRIYDTTTSKKVMEYSEVSDVSDIVGETAYYRTRSGLYFRHEQYGRHETIQPLPLESLLLVAKQMPEIVCDPAWLYRAEFARSGGKAKSERKAAAARENGKKGGRPKANKNN